MTKLKVCSKIQNSTILIKSRNKMVPFETIFQNIIEIFENPVEEEDGICNCADGGGKPFSESNF